MASVSTQRRVTGLQHKRLGIVEKAPGRWDLLIAEDDNACVPL